VLHRDAAGKTRRESPSCCSDADCTWRPQKFLRFFRKFSSLCNTDSPFIEERALAAGKGNKLRPRGASTISKVRAEKRSYTELSRLRDLGTFFPQLLAYSREFPRYYRDSRAIGDPRTSMKLRDLIKIR